ncbi:MAG: penicillin-binding transpeptidase domain-containing protein [Bacillota bacterium]|nr:penicillin-binding transpeptidase domain-containing protein [Bacillota bacterium]
MRRLQNGKGDWQSRMRQESPARASTGNSGRRRVKRRVNRRPGIIFVGFCLFFFASFLVWQLYQIQIVNHAVYAEKATAQHYKRIPEDPRRGSIYDRNGVELAGTTYVHQIGITPKDVYSISKNISTDEIAAAVAQSLDLPLVDIKAALSQKDASYVLLKKDVSREMAEQLRTWKTENQIGGIRIDTEARRYYTNGSLASQIIGFCRYDDGLLVGQLGVELQYNNLLTGQPGYTYVETDNYTSMGVLPFSVPTSLRAQDGQNLVLTLDINIQKIIQDELERAIGLYDITDGGQVIIMDPYTGAVLAMASWPYFSSSEPTACPPDQDVTAWNDQDNEAIEYLSANVWRNRAISDAYEPGSTMKSITMAITLEEAIAHEKSVVTCQPIKLYNWTISCVKKGGHGEETLEMGFWRSCNPVFAQLALNIGVNRFYTYMRAFGFTAATGIDLPGEGSGILHSQPTDLDMATLSYGESSTVTPLQLATAYSVFANGGKLVRPTVVKAVTDSDGAMVRETRPETLRQVVSEQTAARVRDLMQGVVLYGTGSPAYVEGYGIAGKTSTSTDDFGDHTLSFAGLAPAENPEIVVLVVLDKPEDKELSSKIAAKTCGLIISRTLEYLGRERVYSDTDISRLTSKTSVPDLNGLTLGAAMRQLADMGLRGEAGDAAMGDATLVKYQWPAAETELHNRGLVMLYPVTNPQKTHVTVPDFRGRTINECLTMAAESGLNIRIDSDCLGVAVSQDPTPTYENTPVAPAPTATAPDNDASSGDAGSPDDDEITGDEDPDLNEPVMLQRGDIVTLVFAAVVEELAQSGPTE